MEFKKLELKPEGNWLKRTLQSQHVRKTILYMTIGAVGSFAYFYWIEGQHLAHLTLKESSNSLLFGAFMGLFITNSPCARGKC